MKKAFSLLLAVLLLAAMTTGFAGSAGTASDPLISRSYLTGSFETQFTTAAESAAADAFDSLYDTSVRQADRLRDNFMLRSGGYADYTLSDGYVDITLSPGEKVYLRTGASFVLSSGSATLTVYDGEVINASTGVRTLSGNAAKPNHRYFCTESTLASFTAVTGCKARVDGYSKLSGKITDKAMQFSDVGSTVWYFGSVNYAFQNDLFRGVTETTFEPNTAMSRGMFVTVLHRLSGAPEASGNIAFKDVEPGRYYSDAVVWATTNGILQGYEDNTFRPDVSVSREQMAVLLYRYAAYEEQMGSYFSKTTFKSFNDCDSTSKYAKDAMAWATDLGIVNGSYGNLLPKDPATRAQVAQIILNFSALVLGR